MGELGAEMGVVTETLSLAGRVSSDSGGGHRSDPAGASSPALDRHCDEELSAGAPLKASSELLQTESSFIRKMEAIDSHFHRLLMAQIAINCNEFPNHVESRLETLFVHAANIAYAHKQLLGALEDAARTDTFLCELGATFRQFTERADSAYLAFATNYTETMYIIKRYRESYPRFQEFVLVSELVTKERIDSLMIAPMQRLPRILLLLEVLQRKQAADSFERESIHVAMEAVLVLIEKIDVNVKHGSDIASVRKLQDEYFAGSIDLLGMPGRKLIRKASAIKLYSPSSKRIARGIRCFVMIFNDCLIYGEQTKKHRIKHVLTMDGMSVHDVANCDQFSNMLRVDALLKPVTFVADSPTEKHLLMDSISEAIAAFAVSKMTDGLGDPMNLERSIRRSSVVTGARPSLTNQRRFSIFTPPSPKRSMSMVSAGSPSSRSMSMASFAESPSSSRSRSDDSRSRS